MDQGRGHQIELQWLDGCMKTSAPHCYNPQQASMALRAYTYTCTHAHLHARIQPWLFKNLCFTLAAGHKLLHTPTWKSGRASPLVTDADKQPAVPAAPCCPA